MELELAVALACGPEGCHVRYIEGGASVEVAYADQVRDQIKVRPGDLVAVDRAPEPARLVWRWWHGRVEAVTGDEITVSRNVTQSGPDDPRRITADVALGADWRDQVAPGDLVYYGGEPKAVLDVARAGKPSRPERLREEHFPAILAAYQ